MSIAKDIKQFQDIYSEEVESNTLFLSDMAYNKQEKIIRGFPRCTDFIYVIFL